MRSLVLVALALSLVACEGTVIAPAKDGQTTFLFPYRVDSLPECDGGPGLYIWAYLDTHEPFGQLDALDRRYAQTFVCDGQDGEQGPVGPQGPPGEDGEDAEGHCRGSRGKGNNCGHGR